MDLVVIGMASTDASSEATAAAAAAAAAAAREHVKHLLESNADTAAITAYLATLSPDERVAVATVLEEQDQAILHPAVAAEAARHSLQTSHDVTVDDDCDYDDASDGTAQRLNEDGSKMRPARNFKPAALVQLPYASEIADMFVAFGK